MKNKTIYIVLFYLFVSLLFSCKTSDNVVSQHFLTKRKYTKGWYMHSHTNENKTVARHIQTEETAEIKSIEKDNFSDNQSALIYAQADEQMLLPEKKLQSNIDIPETNSLAEKTDTLPAKKKVKKNFLSRTKEVDAEGKKTNMYALYSLLAIIGSIILFGLFSVFVGIEYSKLIDFLMGITFWGAYPIGAAALLGFHAYIERSKNPDKYKNNRLAIPAVVVGIFLALASLASAIFLLIYLDSSSIWFIIYVGIFLIPFIIISLFFYMAFIKNYHKEKKVYTKEEKEQKQNRLKKLGRWGVILMAVGFVMILLLVIFAEAFLILLPNSLDFYAFLFACGLFLTGLVLKITSMRIFRKLID